MFCGQSCRPGFGHSGKEIRNLDTRQMLTEKDMDKVRVCCRRRTDRARDFLSRSVQMMCVNIKALVSEINQITLKSCYKKVSTRKFTYFFCGSGSVFSWLWCCECGQWREFDKLCHLYSSIFLCVFFVFVLRWDVAFYLPSKKHLVHHHHDLRGLCRRHLADSRFVLSVYERACDRMWASEWTTEIWVKIKALNEFIIRMYIFFLFILLFSIPLAKAVSYSFNSFRISSREQTKHTIASEREREERNINEII